ncbi:MAG: lanthionine synthetase C family protein [Candidatus Obscuribacterales bacterium]
MKQKHSIHQILGNDRCNQALKVGRIVAFRLQQKDLLKNSIESSLCDSSIFSWNSAELSSIAILFSYLDSLSPLENFDRVAHEYLVLALKSDDSYAINSLALHGGIAKLGFAAHLLSKSGVRYQSILKAIDSLVIKRALENVSRLKLQYHSQLRASDYDLIVGLCGTAVYLLSRDVDETRLTLQEVIATLVLISSNGFKIRGNYRVGFTAADASFELGLIDLGLAHGLAGVLATLSLAYSNNCVVDGLEVAIRQIAELLINNTTKNLEEAKWPYAIALDKQEELIPSDCGSRDAWCYGAPGIARSLWLAGTALNEDVFREFAMSAIENVAQRLIVEGVPRCPSFCHGKAGLLQIFLRFSIDTGSEVACQMLCHLFDELMQDFDLEAPLGFRSLSIGGCTIDDPTILNGACGIALVLLACGSNEDPCWDRMFLLS